MWQHNMRGKRHGLRKRNGPPMLNEKTELKGVGRGKIVTKKGGQRNWEVEGNSVKNDEFV